MFMALNAMRNGERLNETQSGSKEDNSNHLPKNLFCSRILTTNNQYTSSFTNQRRLYEEYLKVLLLVATQLRPHLVELNKLLNNAKNGFGAPGRTPDSHS